MKELTGHTSPDTAYLVPDYPYGFTLRTEIRYWIETKKGHGQRTMSQTRNPKKPGQPWNKPKASTYNPVRVLVLNEENGHVEHDALSPYATEAQLDAFVAKYPETSKDERNRKQIHFLIASARVQSRITYTVTSQSGTPTPEEIAAQKQRTSETHATIRKATLIEYAKLQNETKE